MDRADNTIPERVVLDAQSAWQASWREGPLPTGLKRERHDGSYTDNDGQRQEFTYHTYTLPEAGPKRLYGRLSNLRDGIVVPIAGRNWRVRIIDNSRWGGCCEVPEAGDYQVVFEYTGDPETPHEVWDHDADIQQYKLGRERRIAEEREWLRENNTPEYNEEGRVLTDEEIEAKVRDYCRGDFDDLEQIEQGKLCLRPGGDLHFFGQPQFIQNEVMPVGPRGECAMHLCTLETGWGDCGNENFLFTVDENGVPCAVWHEASAH